MSTYSKPSFSVPLVRDVGYGCANYAKYLTLIMINKLCVYVNFFGRRLHTGLRLDYRFRPRAPTSASRAISAVAEFLVLTSEVAEQFVAG